MKKKLALSLLFLFFGGAVMSHPLDAENLSHLNNYELFIAYIKIGFLHIIPLGLDHILFILSLYFLNKGLKNMVLLATVFTVAHSITLGLAMVGIVAPLPFIIEPLIALSIAFVAIENILAPETKKGRILIVFLFGLVHGLGFAGALAEVGIPEGRFGISLLSFNMGVELGQLSVILLSYLLIGKWWSEKEWYQKRIVTPASLAIGAVALVWTFERIFI